MPVIAPLVIGGAAKLYGGYQAYQGEQDARNQLNRLNQQPVPKYNVNSAIARLYGGAANEVARPVGYTGAEINAFNQNIGRGLNTQRANAMNFSGGSGSRAINSVLGGNQLNAYNTFAGQDAALARQYRNAAFSRLMGAGNTMQNIDNQNTQTALQRRLMQEQLLGNAISSNRAYQTNTLNSLGSDLMSVGAMGIGGGGGMGIGGGGDGVGKTYLGRNSRISPYFNQNRANRQASAYDYLENFPEYNQMNR
jgi:hypothetical protein